jgi:hypothetical protein
VQRWGVGRGDAVHVRVDDHLDVDQHVDPRGGLPEAPMDRLRASVRRRPGQPAGSQAARSPGAGAASTCCVADGMSWLR